MRYESIAFTRRNSQTDVERFRRRFRLTLASLMTCATLLGCQSTSEPYLASTGQKASPRETEDNRLAWEGIRGGRRAVKPQSGGVTGVVLASSSASRGSQKVHKADYVDGAETEAEIAILAPMVVGGDEYPGQLAEAPALSVSTEMIGDGPMIYLSPHGVGPDQPGLADNVSARIGATYYSVNNTSTPGGVAILESSKQVGGSAIFAHGGVGTEYLDGEWPVSGSVGFSKLATIVDGEVVKPLILDGTYDMYWDTEFFGTDDAVYMDQVRMLAGYALSARFDAGVWAAIGLQSDSGWRPAPGGRNFVRSDFADRIAAYFATNVGNLGSLVIVSAGWEDNPGNYFMEGNTFVPLTQNVNFWGGGGYSDAGSYDMVAGLELTMGRRGRATRTVPGTYDECPPDVCASACGVTGYRGGWANDNYRGALRVINPSRARRMLADPSWQFLADPATPPPAGNNGGTVDPGGVVIPPPVIGGNDPIPVDECEPRFDFRPTRESNLTRFLDSLQATNL